MTTNTISSSASIRVNPRSFPFSSSASFCVDPRLFSSFIVRKLDALREETQRLESLYKQKLSDLDELKKSILDRAFRGQL